jgi:hypothetical protein
VKPAQKTNAARLLDQMGIHYELREYDVDPDDLAAETVAAKIGCRPSRFSRRWSRAAVAVKTAAKTATELSWR